MSTVHPTSVPRTAKAGIFSRRSCLGLTTTAIMTACLWLTIQAPGRAAESVVNIPPPATDLPAGNAHTATAVFAGGCFWGVQAVFQHVNGVIQAVSGYAGGSAETAHYMIVGTGRTGHAEAVQISYDPQKITYGQLLQIYFSVAHDPTQLNRQGPDTGTQYRSTLFVADAGQQRVAEAYIAQLNGSGRYPQALATTIEPLQGFYRAEAYHQDYLVHHPHSPYIMINDQPKVDNLAKAFPKQYRETPVLVGG